MDKKEVFLSALIIDPSRLVQAVAKKALSSVRLFFAESADEGVRLAIENKVGLVVVSGHAADVSGFDIAKRIRETEGIECVPIVMMSSSDDDENVRQAYESGVNAFISKDNFAEDLKKVIATFEEHGTTVFHKNVFLISRNEKTYNVLRSRLNEFGIHVDFESALDKSIVIKALENGYDYVIIEDFADSASALTVAKLLIQARIGNVMILVDKTRPERKEAFNGLGVEDFYAKPFIFDEFISHLLQILTKTAISISKTVLVVDDSDVYRDEMSRILSGIGIEVVTAVDGEDGLQKLARHKVDLIVTDLYMPKMDGERLIQRIREKPEHEDIPIIVATTADKKKKIFSCFELGASDFINKPIVESEIIARLKRFLK